MSSAVDIRTQHLLRDLAPRVLGVIVRRFRDFAAAEDAVQEALLAASSQWPQDGMPDSPLAWLIQVASRRLKDHVRAGCEHGAGAGAPSCGTLRQARREEFLAVDVENAAPAPTTL